MTMDSSEEESGQIERYKFNISYNGTAFSGFQIQGQTRTVQMEVEKVLRKFGWQEKSITAAGRTDSGVHAKGQVISAALKWSHGIDKLLIAMNANLPEDISVTSIEPVPDNFHARFDALNRCYHYNIYTSPIRDPIRDLFFWRVWSKPEYEKLEDISKEFIGIHDFRAFGSPPRKDRGTVRNIIESRWIKSGDDELTYVVRANAFLYHMVRRLVFIQISYAQDYISKERVKDAIRNGIDAKPGLAPSCGLQFWEACYKKQNDLNE